MQAVAALGRRRLTSWLAGFEEYTRSLNIWTTDLYTRWSAISTVAAALERRVYIRSQGSNIYPNLYVFLVGPPGAGKTRAVGLCEDIWEPIKEIKRAPVSLTKASLMDEIGNAKRVINGDETFNSLYVASLELGALIPNYDADFLNALTFLYDGLRYDEKRRGNKEHLIIERPVLNLIGCTTPSFLLETMPAGAWDQGFLSRVIIINDEPKTERPFRPLDEETTENLELRRALEADLITISQMSGKFTFDRAAADIVQSWYSNKDLRPTHPRLQHYNTRRPIHMLKLCMIATADRAGSDNIISLEDAQFAIDWLTEAEDAMIGIFKAMVHGGDMQVMSECAYWVNSTALRTGKAVPAHLLQLYLSNKLPAASVSRVLEQMLNARMIVRQVVDGNVMYVAGRLDLIGEL